MDVSTVKGGWHFSSEDGGSEALPWCILLQVQHTGPLIHLWEKHTANGGDYTEKQCFVAENLLDQIALLDSSYLL